MENTESSARPTTAAVGGFVIVALGLPCAVFGNQFFTWMVEQFGIMSASTGFLVHAGKVMLFTQAVVSIITSGAFFIFSHNALRPVYKGWLVASVFAIPAILLKFLGPNDDQTGSLLQIILAVVAILATVFVRRGEIEAWRGRSLVALAVVPVVVWPFLLWGALGSGSDAVLNLLAGLLFGLLASLLISTTTNNFLLDGLGISCLLMLLGSAFGYDGSQLILITILPPLGFAAAALAPSVLATTLLIGLATAFPFTFFDPTEFTLVLGGNEISGWATNSTILVVVLTLALGVILWLLRKWQNRPKTPAIPAVGGAVTWIAAIAVFLTLGQPGFYGDRLFVILKDQADLSQAYTITDRTERLVYVYRTLTSHADNTQADLRQMLDGLGIAYKPYYLVNAIEIRGGTLTRMFLSSRPEVDRIIASPVLRPLPSSIPTSSGEASFPSGAPGWNIEMIGADKVWNEFGVTGQGIVIGNSDTGVQGDHPALQDSYRGLTEGDDYNWYDPWDGTTSPNDQQGHGTHTTGTIVGSGGIGVAPGAQWIGCVNLERNLGNPALYLECMQFMLAPFPHGGNPLTDGDPSRAPHVLNNSWGCPPIEGCDPNALKPAADALRAAGIFVVVSAGNDGPACDTVNAPLALYDSVFSVGAVDYAGDLAGFSSRGPVTADGSNRQKPDIAAPGVEVFSSMPGSTYASNSGTSMAGPHVVGVVALLWSAAPELIGNIDQTEEILRDTAQPYNGIIVADGGCDDLPLPNNGVGYGIVDVYAAVQRALGK